MLHRKELFTIPNLLSFYRMFAFPLILYFIFSGKEQLFAIFLIINLVTDVLDGMIARWLRQETDFGARIDSIADFLTYALAFLGIYFFKLDEFLPHATSFLTFVGLTIAVMLLSLIKFGRLPSLHLYSWKIGGYIQGFFFIWIFAIGFNTPLYYFMITWAILSAIEHIVIQLIIPEMRSNAKGLYWILKQKQ